MLSDQWDPCANLPDTDPYHLLAPCFDLLLFIVLVTTCNVIYFFCLSVYCLPFLFPHQTKNSLGQGHYLVQYCITSTTNSAWFMVGMQNKFVAWMAELGNFTELITEATRYMRSGASEWQNWWASLMTAPTWLTISVSKHDSTYYLYHSFTYLFVSSLVLFLSFFMCESCLHN